MIALQETRCTERKNRLLAAGADRVLTTEPYERVVVHARRLLDESCRIFVEAIRHGPFVCDLGNNRVTAQGSQLDLFPTERLLLANLVREPGVVVPWQDLTFDVLRRPPDDAAQKALYHCFWRTRRKLGRLGKWLRAHRGIGYEALVCDAP